MQVTISALLVLVGTSSAFMLTPSRPVTSRHIAVHMLEGLTTEQEKVLVEASTKNENFQLTLLLSADAAKWSELRTAYPALESLDDATLKAAVKEYITATPDIFDVLFKTPVGPVVIANVLAYFTGFSWCSTPFVDSQSQACIELASRAS